VTARGDGAIVLLHTWPDPVAPALAELVQRLRDGGATFVRVDELGVGDELASIGSPQPPVPAPTA
jgi:peptidoglycan/xylan/chitin deacetylase (PgdA/CDA1 family)